MKICWADCTRVCKTGTGFAIIKVASLKVAGTKIETMKIETKKVKNTKVEGIKVAVIKTSQSPIAPNAIHIFGYHEWHPIARSFNS